MISPEAVFGVSAQSIRMLQIPKIFLITRSIVDWFSERFPVVRARRSAGRRSVGHDPRKPNPGRREILAQLRILMRGINRICRFRGVAFRFDGAPARRVARLAK